MSPCSPSGHGEKLLRRASSMAWGQGVHPPDSLLVGSDPAPRGVSLCLMLGRETAPRPVSIPGGGGEPATANFIT